MIEFSSWYKRRPYIHFDLPLTLADAANYVIDPNRVANHPFYPFLTYNLLTPRIKKAPAGSLEAFVKYPKKRPISYPAHKDGYIFSYYKSKLEPLYEKWLDENGLKQTVTAFRSIGENNVTLAKKAFDFIKANPDCRIVVADIESFFDRINHESLKRIWARFLGVNELPKDHYAVYKAVTRYRVVQRHKVYNLFGIPLFGRLDKAGDPKRLCTPQQFRDKVIPNGLLERNPGLRRRIGIPQGSSLSPLLANMYMADVDLAMHNWITSLGGRYWRYCDDILVVVPRRPRAPICGRLDEELGKLELKRSRSKNQDVNSNQLMQGAKELRYLGFTFNGRSVLVRSSSIHRYHRKLKSAINAAEQRREKESIKSGTRAPLRQQSLYNMYSDLGLRGKRIRARKRNQKYRGNFTHYLARASDAMSSQGIEQQRTNVLKKFRSSVRKHI